MRFVNAATYEAMGSQNNDIAGKKSLEKAFKYAIL
jgi:hypothetical protein